MLKKLSENKGRWLVVAVLIFLLVCIRAFEAALFYDPFLDFFKGEFQAAVLPEYHMGALFGGLFLRYFLNTVLSLLIIYFIFKDVSLVKLAALLYVFFLVVLLTAFFAVLLSSDKPDYMLLFYIRRFLIQPLFLVLFIPAFYYQQKNS